MAESTIETTSYAIDLGTSNTVVARWNTALKRPETITISGLSQQVSNNPPLIPSLVYVEDASRNQIVLGQAVRDRGLDLDNNPRFFHNFKRGIGSSIPGFIPELDDRTITFDRVGTWFLSEIINRLREDSHEIIQSLVLTVPVDSFEAYRHWLSKVCQSLSAEKISILDESTAAALGYGIEEELLLVVDCGGGTIDISLVQLPKQKGKLSGSILKWGEKFLGESAAQKAKVARVLAKAGQNLGGSDIDDWLVDYFQQEQGLSKSAVTVRLAERLKIQLSSQNVAKEVYFDDETLESYELELDRDCLEKILEQQQFFARLDESIAQVLQQARRNGVEIADINAVLLVGGTAQIPALQNWLKQYFDSAKIRSDRPFEAIVHGALQITQGLEVKDFLYHSYGIRYWNRRKNCHDWHPIVKTGQPYPMNQTVELVLGATLENQPSIELIVGELASQTTTTEVYFDGDRLMTRFLDREETVVETLNDRDGARTIARLNPLGTPGKDRIKLEFMVDEQRFLRITVEDLLTQEILLEKEIVARLS